jgi:hypothetical protein
MTTIEVFSASEDKMTDPATSIDEALKLLRIGTFAISWHE